MRIGFDNDKYIQMQSQKILQRIEKFGDKLYLEFGGKLFDDYHASRVVPGFLPDTKINMLRELKDSAEIILAIHAGDIERNKIRNDIDIAYDREAYAGIENGELRITFDRELRWRDTDVDLRFGGGCRPLLRDDRILMEIKIPGAAPLWLAHLLSENHIVSETFSKYGAYYKQAVLTPDCFDEYKKEALSIA